MRKYFIILLVVSFLGCNSENTNYYYGKENFRTFLCSWDHYIVVEDLGDSLQIWNLDDECNAGYWTTENMTINKAPGKHGKISITSINENKINLILDRGHEKVDFELIRQSKNKKVFRVINIVQMLKLDDQMEKYIKSNSTNAEKNTVYLTENYIADSMAEKLTPKEFYEYYSIKKKAKAEEIIKELNKE
jgi:hypothetical protein